MKRFLKMFLTISVMLIAYLILSNFLSVDANYKMFVLFITSIPFVVFKYV